MAFFTIRLYLVVNYNHIIHLLNLGYDAVIWAFLVMTSFFAFLLIPILLKVQSEVRLNFICHQVSVVLMCITCSETGFQSLGISSNRNLVQKNLIEDAQGDYYAQKLGSGGIVPG